jgi:hypothetical protein
MKEGFFLEQIIVPIALFVVTTDNPPEKLSWSARRIFPNIWWDDVFRNWVHRFAEAVTAKPDISLALQEIPVQTPYQ